MEATLWPGRGVRGVLSDETALELYELSDVNPARIDITVPRAHRIRREIPSESRVHHEDLPEGDVTSFEGIPIVTPARAIRQAHVGRSLWQGSRRLRFSGLDDACEEYPRYIERDRQRKPSTLREYDSIFRNHVLPHLGSIPQTTAVCDTAVP
jgi:predicted transcriptional regulator of viral defense system